MFLRSSNVCLAVYFGNDHFHSGDDHLQAFRSFFGSCDFAKPDQSIFFINPYSDSLPFHFLPGAAIDE